MTALCESIEVTMYPVVLVVHDIEVLRHWAKAFCLFELNFEILIVILIWAVSLD
jgi:hypothetical protein